MVGPRKISTQIFGAAFVAVGIGAHALSRYAAMTSEMEAVTQRTVLAGRMDGLVNAIVMESRGIYMSADAQDAERFALPLLADLAQMKRLVGEWRALHGPQELAAFEAVAQKINDFIAFRTELVKRGRELGPAAANAFGNNEDNRSNRKALNTALRDVARLNESRAAATDAERDVLQSHSLWLQAVGVLLIAAGLAVALTLVHFRVARPLRGLAKTMQRLAAGQEVGTIPSVNQRDEVGDMARSLAVFHDTAVARAALEADAKSADSARVRRQGKREDLTAEFNIRIDRVLDTVRRPAVSMPSPPAPPRRPRRPAARRSTPPTMSARSRPRPKSCRSRSPRSPNASATPTAWSGPRPGTRPGPAPMSPICSAPPRASRAWSV